MKVKTGKIFVDNLDISQTQNVEKIRKMVGIVFQNPENQIIFNKFYDEISFSLKELKEEEIEKRLRTALEKVEMSEFVDRDLYELSLGQQQRIVLAEVLAKKPKYIILDEPTTMIDSFGKEKIYTIIKNLKQEGYTIICITNLADEILLADRTLILENGKIVSEIEKEKLLSKANEFKKFGIKLPTILEILMKLKQINIEINLENYTVENLISELKRRFEK